MVDRVQNSSGLELLQSFGFLKILRVGAGFSGLTGFDLTATDKSLLTRAYLPSSRSLTGSLSTASMSFCQLQLLAASQLDPSCQLLFIYFARFFVVLKPESKNQNVKFCH